MKDYYAILEVDRKAAQIEIKKAYRQKALQFHPDRNQGSREATEKFKEITEAYGVLSDPKKRQQYDMDLRSGFQHSGTSQNYHYNQEEIFRDFFNNPTSSESFQDLLREFEKAGLSFDQRFVEKVFFGGRSILWGGIFIFGMFGPRKLQLPLRILQQLPLRSIVTFIGRSVTALLTNDKQISQPPATVTDKSSLDSNYEITVPRERAEKGTSLTIALPKELGGNKVKVTIPAQTSSNTRMRLKGKGKEKKGARGDLFLTIRVD